MEEVMIKGWNRELTYALNIQKELGEKMYDKYMISHNHYLVMGVIINNPEITQYRISRVLHFTKQRVNQLVKRLLEEEYVSLKVEEGGRKRKMLLATKEGIDMINDIDSGKLRLIKELVGEEEVEYLIETFARLERINREVGKRALNKGLFNTKYL